MQALYNWYRRVIRHPQYRWWVILGTLVYLVSPFDLAPDFIPIIGEIDDIALVTLLISELSQVFLEWMKSRQVEKSIPNESKFDDNGTTDQASVDVKAVSVE